MSQDFIISPATWNDHEIPNPVYVGRDATMRAKMLQHAASRIEYAL